MLVKFSAKELAVAADAAREELYFFARWMMLRRFGIKWLRAPHHERICDALMRVYRGEIKRLVLNLPPRYSKTELIECFVAWTLGHAPDSEYIYTSYAATLAADNSWKTREIVEHEAYREIFPQVRLRGDAQARDDWRTTAGGRIYATGAEGGLTGIGAGKERPGFGGAILIDDPHKPEEATREVTREGILKWYHSTLQSRVNSRDTPIVVIMQRLHERDLAGWLLEGGSGEKWEHVCCPAITDEGNALWPEKHTLEDLQRMQSADPYVFAGQYLQVPRPPGGAFFTEEHLLIAGPAAAEGLPTRFPIEPIKHQSCVLAVIDTAVKTGKEHDGLGVIYCAYSQNLGVPLTVLDWELTQIDGALLEAWLPNVFRKLEGFAKELEAVLGALPVFIEDKAAGMVLLQQAKNKQWPAQAINSKLTSLGKVERAVNISGYVFAGKVKLSRQAYLKTMTYKGSTRNHLLSQILAFSPQVKDQGQDDLLDCFSYAVALTLGNSRGF
ncbi:MAG: phage terminase large subunit [Steroidobacteraceae bacterium]